MDAGGTCDDVRGVDSSGCGAITDVMAREEESPWALDGLYGED